MKIIVYFQSIVIIILAVFLFKDNIDVFLQKNELGVPPLEEEISSEGVVPAEGLAQENITSVSVGGDDLLSTLDELKKLDKKLILVNFFKERKEFIETDLYRKLKNYPAFKVYTILEFSIPIDYKVLYKLERLGFSKVFTFKDDKYLGRKVAVFYTSFGKVRNSFRYSKIIDGYILENFTARGFYKLGIRSDVPADDLLIRVSVPFSNPGKEIVEIDSGFVEEASTIKKKVSGVNGLIRTKINPDQKITFKSEIKSVISLKENLDISIHNAGRGIYLPAYIEEMKKNYPKLYKTFTQYSEKVVPSSYIDSIVSKIDKEEDLTDMWKQITRFLDQDIYYDWSKRDLFFNGRLTYNSIKDMYLTSAELGEKKIGACPERTSLEIALLRQMGVASRSFTRLYHIYTEVFIPQKGWITTSSTLNEIPLCRSNDEKIAYFIDWTPKHPVRLKWEGGLLPLIAQDFFNHLPNEPTLEGSNSLVSK